MYQGSIGMFNIAKQITATRPSWTTLESRKRNNSRSVIFRDREREGERARLRLGVSLFAYRGNKPLHLLRMEEAQW